MKSKIEIVCGENATTLTPILLHLLPSQCIFNGKVENWLFFKTSVAYFVGHRVCTVVVVNEQCLSWRIQRVPVSVSCRLVLDSLPQIQPLSMSQHSAAWPIRLVPIVASPQISSIKTRRSTTFSANRQTNGETEFVQSNNARESTDLHVTLDTSV